MQNFRCTNYEVLYCDAKNTQPAVLEAQQTYLKAVIWLKVFSLIVPDIVHKLVMYEQEVISIVAM